MKESFHIFAPYVTPESCVDECGVFHLCAGCVQFEICQTRVRSPQGRGGARRKSRVERMYTRPEIEFVYSLLSFVLQSCRSRRHGLGTVIAAAAAACTSAAPSRCSAAPAVSKRWVAPSKLASVSPRSMEIDGARFRVRPSWGSCSPVWPWGSVYR